jgi:hypothetical protein
MKLKLTYLSLLALGFAALVSTPARSQESKAGATLEVKINYSGSGTVSEKNKIYLALWDSPDFVSGGGAMPIDTQAVTSKDGTAVFNVASKGPVYVSAAYDPSGKWDAQSGPPPSGTSLGIYSKEAGKPAPINVESGKKASVELAFDDSFKMP